MEDIKETTFAEANVDPESGELLLTQGDIAAISRAELKRIRKNEKRSKDFAKQRAAN